MDVTYTDSNRIDDGVLHNFDIDFDATDTADFVISVGIENNVLKGGSWWYIDGTEYGGVVDTMECDTESNEIKYSGRNFRSVMKSKIIQPPSGADYKVVSGNIANISNALLQGTLLDSLFVADNSNIAISSFQFDRYINVYDGLVALAYSKSKVLVLTYSQKDSKVHISFADRVDYSEEMEYNQDDIGFRIEKHYKSVNHLICLGQGELKDRAVLHLYVDEDGDIVEEQAIFGLDEVVEVYDNTSAQTLAELKEGGVNRLGELSEKDSFEVTAPDMALKIGDIIGGYDSTTDIRVRREIVNIIANISDDKVDIQYKVGGDEVEGSSIPHDIYTYVLPIAKSNVLGGIKVGNDLEVSLDGTASVPRILTLQSQADALRDICA